MYNVIPSMSVYLAVDAIRGADTATVVAVEGKDTTVAMVPFCEDVW